STICFLMTSGPLSPTIFPYTTLFRSLLNCLEVISDYNTALFAISKEDLAQFEVTTGDTEGLVNYALSIKGIRLAALIVDRTELRSEEHTSELQSRENLVCRRLLEKKD